MPAPPAPPRGMRTGKTPRRRGARCALLVAGALWLVAAQARDAPPARIVGAFGLQFGVAVPPEVIQQATPEPAPPPAPFEPVALPEGLASGWQRLAPFEVPPLLDGHSPPTVFSALLDAEFRPVRIHAALPFGCGTEVEAIAGILTQRYGPPATAADGSVEDPPRAARGDPRASPAAPPGTPGPASGPPATTAEPGAWSWNRDARQVLLQCAGASASLEYTDMTAMAAWRRTAVEARDAWQRAQRARLLHRLLYVDGRQVRGAFGTEFHQPVADAALAPDTLIPFKPEGAVAELAGADYVIEVDPSRVPIRLQAQVCPEATGAAQQLRDALGTALAEQFGPLQKDTPEHAILGVDDILVALRVVEDLCLRIVVVDRTGLRQQRDRRLAAREAEDAARRAEFERMARGF